MFVRWFLPSSFFLFICWLILLADTSQETLLFTLAESVPYGDKVGHFVLYGTLALLLNIALRFHRIRLVGRRYFTASVAVLAFTTLEEISQFFLPMRTADMGDMFANVAGIMVFSLLSVKWRLRSLVCEQKRARV